MNYLSIKLPGDKWLAFVKGKNIADSLQQLYEAFPNVLRLFHISNVEDEDEAILIAKLLDKVVIDVGKSNIEHFLDKDSSEVILKIKLNGESWGEFKRKTVNASMSEYLKKRFDKNNIAKSARQMRINRKTAYRLLEKYKDDLN